MEVGEIVDANPHFEFFKNGTKIRCIPTGHEMPARLEPLQAYMNCRKYKQLERNTRMDLKFNYSKYEPYIIQHKKDPNQLFCQVTRCPLNKVPSQVEAHVSGKKYKKKLKAYDEQMKNGDGDNEQSELLSDREEFEDEEEEDEESVAEQDAEKEEGATEMLQAKKKAVIAETTEKADKKTLNSADAQTLEEMAKTAETTEKADKKKLHKADAQTLEEKAKTAETTEKADKKKLKKANKKKRGEKVVIAETTKKADKKKLKKTDAQTLEEPAKTVGSIEKADKKKLKQKLKKKLQKAKYLARKREEKAEGVEATDKVDEQKENRTPDTEKNDGPAVGEKRKKREGEEDTNKSKKKK